MKCHCLNQICKRTKLLLILALIGCHREEKVSEPVYKGIKLGDWLQQTQLKGNDLVLQDGAVEAVRALGTNALPWLIREVTAEESQGTHLQHYFDGTPTAYDRNEKVVPAFQVLGAVAAPAVAPLARTFEAWENYSSARSCSIRALAAIGPAAIPALCKGLTNAAPDSRRECAEALSSLPPADEETVAALVKGLGDPDPVVRSAMATALGTLQADPDTVVPALMKAVLMAPTYVEHPLPRTQIAGTPARLIMVDPKAFHEPGRSRWQFQEAAEERDFQVAAINALAAFGSKARSVAPQLMSYQSTIASKNDRDEDRVISAIEEARARIGT